MFLSLRTVDQGMVAVVTILVNINAYSFLDLTLSFFIERIHKRIIRYKRSAELGFQAVTVDHPTPIYRHVTFSVLDQEEETIKM